MSSFITKRAVIKLSFLAAMLFASGLKLPAGAQMSVGDIMTAGGFSAGTESKDDVARDQRAANNWNNAGQSQNELTTSQGGKLPDSIGSPGGSGGGGSSAGHESPVRSAKMYTTFPVGFYDMGSNHDDAVGMADGRQQWRQVKPTGSGGGGGEFVPSGFSGRGNVYGSYAGNHYASNGTTAQSVNGGAQPPAAAGDKPACCKGNLPCCAAKWPCCPSGADNNSQSNNQSNNNQSISPRSLLDPGKGLTDTPDNGGSDNPDPNADTVVTPPETEPLLGPPQTYSGLSAPMAANMRDLMRQAGLDGPQGGKMLGAAEAGILGLASTFQQLKAANMPGASSEQAKVNQNAEHSQTADNLAGMEREQAATAIDFVRSYLENFTTNGGNKWNRLRDNLFVPMALLLLLPGAVLAQVKSIVSQGFSVLGEVNPWEGILRAVVGIFLIPATYLIMNYGIDVANSFTKTIADQYQSIFHSDMYEDAFSGHVRAFPVRLPEENFTVIPNIEATMFNYFGNSPLARLEGKLLAIKYYDPAVGLYIVPPDRAAETVPFLVNEARLMYNRINAGLAFAWTILCAVQQCYLYYLWFVGPVVAALWVYPMGQLRQAFPNWIEGVVSLCFWSFFWSTTILLMACFRGVDDTGTIVFTALNFLALGSVKFAFDFSGLVKDAGREAARLAEKASRLAAQGGGNKPSPTPGPNGPNGPKPGPNPDPDPDKIDPLHPLASFNSPASSVGSPGLQLASSNTSSTSFVSNTSTAINSGSSIEGSDTRMSASLPPISTLASAPMQPSAPDSGTPPLSGPGIQVASLDVSTGVPGGNSLFAANNTFATDYPTQAWQQVALDAKQTQGFNADRFAGTTAGQDQIQRETQDRNYQQRQQDEQRREQEKQQQQVWAQAEMQTWQQQQQQQMQQQQAEQARQQEQQQQAVQAAQQQEALRQALSGEQEKAAQQQAAQQQALQSEALTQAQAGRGGYGDLPPFSQAYGDSKSLPPMDGHSGSGAAGLPPAVGLAGANGTAGIPAAAGLPGGVTDLTAGSPAAGLPPGAAAIPGLTSGNAVAPGLPPGTGAMSVPGQSGSDVVMAGHNVSGIPLSALPDGGVPGAPANAGYVQTGQVNVDNSVTSSNFVVSGNSGMTTGMPGLPDYVPGTGPQNYAATYNDSAVQAGGVPASGQPVQAYVEQQSSPSPATTYVSHQQVVDPYSASAYTHGIPQNVLAPNEGRQYWDNLQNPGQLAQAQPPEPLPSHTGRGYWDSIQSPNQMQAQPAPSHAEPLGLKTLGQILPQHNSAPNQVESDSPPTT